jgi:hypothetical protein
MVTQSENQSENKSVPIPDILRRATVLPIAFISGPGTPEQKKPH